MTSGAGSVHSPALAEVLWNAARPTVEADLRAAADAPTLDGARVHVREAVNLCRGLYGLRGMTDDYRREIRNLLRRRIVTRTLGGERRP